MIQLHALRAGYERGSDILHNLEFSLDKGRIAIIEGAAGSGKSTLVRVLTSQLRPSAGTAVVSSYELSSMSRLLHSGLLASIGFVSSEFPLLEDRTVAENIRMAIDLQIKHMRFNGERRTEAVLDRYGLSPVCEQYPRRLSHGMYQRVAMARAVVREPLLLIADEPTALLDDEGTTRIIDDLSNEHRRGMTILITTTRAERYLSMTDSIDRWKLEGGTLKPIELESPDAVPRATLDGVV